MSFRHPFITDFIYQVSEESKTANKEIEEILASHTKHGLNDNVDDAGYYSGIFWGSAEAASIYPEIEELVYELSKITKTSFRLTVMYESGPVTTYNIESNES